MVTNEERKESYGTPIAIGMANGVDEPTITRAVMAVADAEQAELRAEVERLREERDGAREQRDDLVELVDQMREVTR